MDVEKYGKNFQKTRNKIHSDLCDVIAYKNKILQNCKTNTMNSIHYNTYNTGILINCDDSFFYD